MKQLVKPLKWESQYKITIRLWIIKLYPLEIPINQIYIKADTDNYEMSEFYQILLTRDSDHLHHLMCFLVNLYQSHLLLFLGVRLMLLSSFSC